MIIVRENSEVVIIYPDIYIICPISSTPSEDRNTYPGSMGW
jgi:hypothetical protein